jgi:hypothetical protein
MTILLHPSIIAVFFQRKKDADWHLLDKLIRNHKSKIAFTQRLITCWEDAAGDDYRNELITEMIDERAASNITSKGESATCDQEFEHLAQNTSDLLLPFAIVETPNLKTIKNISFLEKIRKPNKHWLLFEIAANHPSKASINHFDCTVKAEIQGVFDTIFKISVPNKTRRIVVFDRLQSDGISHTYFKELRQNNTDYYTLKTVHANGASANQRKINLKSALGNITKMYIAKAKSKTHDRKIVAEKFIIFVSDDFHSLDIGVGNWTIDVQYCPEQAQKWLNDCSDYTEFR